MASEADERLSSERLATLPAVWSCAIEVRFQEVDAAGIVYFPTLISYFHDAYVRLLSDRGLPLHKALQETPWIAPIRHAQADFLRPVRFGDVLHASLVRAHGSTGAISLGWRLSTGGPDGIAHAVGRTVHTFVDRSFRKAAMPDEYRRVFADALAE